RLQAHREQSATTAAVRLNGVKETLAISLRQLAALPLDLSHRRLVPPFVAAGPAPADGALKVDVQQTLERLGTDFGLPLVMLIDRSGALLASTSAARNPGSGTQVNLA